MKRSSIFNVVALAILTAVGSLQAQTPPTEEESKMLYEVATFAHDSSGDLLTAIKAYHQLLESDLDPAMRETVLARLGNALQSVGKEDEARKVFQSYLEQFPDGAHAKKILQGLKEPENREVTAMRLQLLGLWTLLGDDGIPKGYLELMPGERYQRLPHPLDSESQSAPSKPLESGTYAFKDKTLIVNPANGDPLTLSWSLLDNELTLTDSDGNAVTRTRGRRPFRYPKPVDAAQQLSALVRVKAAEAGAAKRFLLDSWERNTTPDPNAALDFFARNEQIDIELRKLVAGTVAENYAHTGLLLLDLAASLLEKGSLEAADNVLLAFDKLEWNQLNPEHLSDYGVISEDLTREWKDYFNANLSTQITTEGEFQHPRSGGTRKVKIDGRRFDYGGNIGWEYYLCNPFYLALYGNEGGERRAYLRPHEDRITSGLERYFANQIYNLNTIIPLSHHERTRKRLLEYYYYLATLTEGTTAGLLSRTALQQVYQLERAHLSKDEPKIGALQEALQSTTKILIEESVPETLKEVGVLVPHDPYRGDHPFHAVYEGTLTLMPTQDRAPDKTRFQQEADKLRNHILENDWLRQVLEQSHPEIRKRYVEVMGDLSFEEMLRLLEERLEIKAQGLPLRVTVSAFPHTDAKVAVSLSNLLGRKIAVMDTTESTWAWRVVKEANLWELPSQLLIESPSFGVPFPKGPKVRGRHPLESHNRFVYETFVEQRASGYGVRMIPGQFVVLYYEGKEIALRYDEQATSDSCQVTIVMPGEAETILIESHKLEFGRGPGGPAALLDKGGVKCYCHMAQISAHDAKGTLSIALTPWTDPDEIDFDAPSLRWYAFQRPD